MSSSTVYPDSLIDAIASNIRLKQSFRGEAAERKRTFV